ncbi:MAG: 50S ribosomal protein L25 [Flavobacteriales bacterium]|nr:50S ribosomal protein L25 [Flavobacteriales bacterium]
MKQVSLSGSPRENVGRKEAAELRRNMRIPGVLYGGSTQVAFSISKIDFDRIQANPDTLQINLDLGGKTYPGVLQEIQMDPVTDRVIHIDLLELVPGKIVRTKLSVHTTGVSEGVKTGGKLTQNYRKVRISGTPENLPDAISIDISALNIGDSIRVREVSVPGCKLHESEASVLVGVYATRASIADAAAAAAPAKDVKKK